MVLVVKFDVNIATKALVSHPGLNPMLNRTIITLEITPAVFVKRLLKPKYILRTIFANIQGRNPFHVPCVVIILDTRHRWLLIRGAMRAYAHIVVKSVGKPSVNHRH